MTATVTIGAPADTRVARLPLSALYNDGAGPAVWRVASDGQLVLSPVTVAAYEARDVLIAGGVDEGAPVVALGVQKLDPGQKVRVVEALRF
jgi:multidrug efflux pump subunit AcrA (membrane-fusion protein)